MNSKKNKKSNNKKDEHRMNKKVNIKHGEAESARAVFGSIDEKGIYSEK